MIIPQKSSETDSGPMVRCSITSSNLNQERQENRCCDATIIAEDKEFPIHKKVLCASSSYFSAMFAGHFSEQGAEKVEIIGVSSETLPLILDYIYGVEIQLTLTNVTDIYGAADMLCLDSIISDCKWFIKMRGESCGSIEQAYEVATQLELHDISGDILERTRWNLYTDVCQKDLLKLSYSFLFKLLEGGCSVLRLQNKSCIMNNILQWALTNPDERFPDPVSKLLSLVHFEYVAQNDFRNCLDILSKEKKRCDIENFSQLKERLESAYLLSHQKAISQGFYLVLPHFSKTMNIYVFNCETWTWEKYGCDLLQQPKMSVLNENQLYLFYTNGSGRKFDLKSKEHVILPAVVGLGCGFGFFVVDETQSVLGCFDHFPRVPPFVTNIMQLEPSCKSWHSFGTWREPRRYFNSVTHAQTVFVVGEEVSTYPDCRPALFEYNTLTRNIKTIFIFQNLPMKPSLAIYEDVLYIFSGTSRQILMPHFVAFDLKLEKVVTSQVNALDLYFPVLSVRAVSSGILIAYSCENAVVLTLYRPHGDCATEQLGVVSLPEEMLQREDLNLFSFYIPK